MRRVEVHTTTDFRSHQRFIDWLDEEMERLAPLARSPAGSMDGARGYHEGEALKRAKLKFLELFEVLPQTKESTK